MLDAWYYLLADAADRGGMEAVLETSANPPENVWALLIGRISEYADKSPEAREMILSLDPKWFASIMRRWGDWGYSGRMHLVNLSDEEVQSTNVPALVLPGDDGDEGLHPERTGLEVHKLLPFAELMDLSTRYSPEEIQTMNELGGTAPTTYCAFYAPFYEDFLSRVESGTFEPDRK